MSQGAAKTRTGVFLPFHERVRAKSYNYKMNKAQCAAFKYEIDLLIFFGKIGYMFPWPRKMCPRDGTGRLGS